MNPNMLQQEWDMNPAGFGTTHLGACYFLGSLKMMACTLAAVITQVPVGSLT